MLLCLSAQDPFMAEATTSSHLAVDDSDIGSLVGHGWRGSVRLGVHEGVAVAVKVVEQMPHLSPTPAKTCHRNVVKVLAHQQASNHLLEVRELCDGGEFFDRMAEAGDGIPADEASELIAELCDGVAHCHAHGLVHGQIRAEHLLMKDGVVKLAGFRSGVGIGITSSSASASASVSMPLPLRPLQPLDAPELHEVPSLHARADAMAAADVRALGVLFAAMVLGYPPEELAYGSRSTRLGSRGLDALPALAAATPPRLRTLIVSMLHPDPSARPTAAQVLLLLRPPADYASPSSQRCSYPEPLPGSAAAHADVAGPSLQPQFEPLSEGHTCSTGWADLPFPLESLKHAVLAALRETSIGFAQAAAALEYEVRMPSDAGEESLACLRIREQGEGKTHVELKQTAGCTDAFHDFYSCFRLAVSRQLGMHSSEQLSSFSPRLYHRSFPQAVGALSRSLSSDVGFREPDASDASDADDARFVGHLADQFHRRKRVVSPALFSSSPPGKRSR